MAVSDQLQTGSGFGSRTEPWEVLEGIDLSGQVVMVTGGYSGLGLETTRALVAAGARVHVPVRSVEKAALTLADMQGDIVVGEMDLGDLASVRAYAHRFQSSEEKLDVLINNAGVMACPETRTGNNWESQFAINHLGHHVLTTGLLPSLMNAGKARVISLSSNGHKRSDIRWHDIHFIHEPYDKWTAYGQSKTANALFALGLDLKFRNQGIRGFSVHPGGILTPLQRHLDNEEMVALGWVDEQGNMSEQVKTLFKTPSQGCSTSLWAATSPALDNKGGLYCEDCDVAVVATDVAARHKGVAPWAVNDESALRLWDLTEKMLENQ